MSDRNEFIENFVQALEEGSAEQLAEVLASNSKPLAQISTLADDIEGNIPSKGNRNKWLIGVVCFFIVVAFIALAIPQIREPILATLGSMIPNPTSTVVPGPGADSDNEPNPEQKTPVPVETTEAAKAEASKIAQDVEAAKVEASQVAQELEKAKGEASQVAQESETAKAEASRVAQESETAKAEASRVAQELETAKAEASQVAQELEKAKAEATKVAQELEKSKEGAGQLIQATETPTDTPAPEALPEINEAEVGPITIATNGTLPVNEITGQVISSFNDRYNVPISLNINSIQDEFCNVDNSENGVFVTVDDKLTCEPDEVVGFNLGNSALVVVVRADDETEGLEDTQRAIDIFSGIDNEWKSKNQNHTGTGAKPTLFFVNTIQDPTGTYLVARQTMRQYFFSTDEAILGGAGDLTWGPVRDAQDFAGKVAGAGEDYWPIALLPLASNEDLPDTLKLVSVDGVSLADVDRTAGEEMGTIDKYPLKLPLYLYAKKKVLQGEDRQPEVVSFINFYLQQAQGDSLVSVPGYVPLDEETKKETINTFLDAIKEE